VSLTHRGECTSMNWTLELVVVPVSDVDRARSFYADRVGFKLDFDTRVGDKMRVIQLTPPGSGCSIALMSGGLATAEPGSLEGVQLVVKDVRAARAELVEREVEVSEVQVFERTGAQRPARDGDDLNNAGFVFFSNPDGNSWAVQQTSARVTEACQ
jgi:catechol 2,3-dioxygenase-like lactoylglutathione lyase family enzyme